MKTHEMASKSTALCVGQILLGIKLKPVRTHKSTVQYERLVSEDGSKARTDQLPVKPVLFSELSASVRESPRHGSRKGSTLAF